MTFESYLESLAAEGETLLYVLQKPLQPVSFHADGAIKATWPAFLPGKKRREGQAWYANTAAFISDRMTERVSAAAANCEFVLVMVLDDIGTKSKTPPIEPTWKMETSPGNFQWGYAFDFDHQPRKGEFAAAIRAIADAGYTDPGACNPVRNFRLPGSVNLKQGRDGFVSRLVEFDETRTFTLAQICDALGVTPGPVEGDGPRPVRVRDDGGDDVFQWLNEQGMVYSRPNGEGWAGVLCPNAAEHTDGSPEGRYNPALRAFCCLHGHCTDWGSERFLTWVTSKGGPSQTSGLREELVSALLKASMPAPTGPLAEEAAAVIAEVERKEAGRLEQAEWFERYCYVESDDSFFDLAERRDLSRRVFDAVYRHIQCFSNFTTQAGKRRQIQASFFFDENRVAKGARSVAGMTYAAGDSELVARNGLVYVNRWRDGRPKVAASTAMPWRWLKHLERVIPNKDEREHVLNVMAWKVQHPTRKINHAVLHGGIQGAGKDSAWAPFFWTVGGSARENVALLENDRLQTQWGYHLESEVIIINELRQVDASDRRALENRLKSVIAAPPEYLVIERKGLHPYDAPNRTLVVAFSNERGAISLSHDDRRWFVIWTDSPPMTLEEGREFWAWLESGGFEQCAAFLHARDVSAFAPGATPMRTEAKALMAGASRSLIEDWLLHEINTRSGEFARPVIGSPWGRFCDVLQGRAPNGTRVTPTAVLHMMSEAGWVDLGQCHSKTHMTKAHIFAHRSWSGTKAEARDLLASYAAGSGGGVLAPLARVK